MRARINIFNHDIETEDACEALVTYASGAWGVIQTTTTVFGGLGHVHEIHGTDGTIQMQQEEITSWQFADNPDGAPPDLAELPDAPQNIVEDMIQAIRDGKPVACTGPEGRRSVELLEAMYLSVAGGPRSYALERTNVLVPLAVHFHGLREFNYGFQTAAVAVLRSGCTAQEDGPHIFRGRRIATVTPCSSPSLVAAIVPPCASTIAWVMANPRPVPPYPATARLAGAVEAVEDVRKVCGVDAYPVIADRDGQTPRRLLTPPAARYARRPQCNEWRCSGRFPMPGSCASGRGSRSGGPGIPAATTQSVASGIMAASDLLPRLVARKSNLLPA